MLAADVECPVRLEVPVVDDGAESEDGLGQSRWYTETWLLLVESNGWRCQPL